MKSKSKFRSKISSRNNVRNIYNIKADYSLLTFKNPDKFHPKVWCISLTKNFKEITLPRNTEIGPESFGIIT